MSKKAGAHSDDQSWLEVCMLLNVACHRLFLAPLALGLPGLERGCLSRAGQWLLARWEDSLHKT